MLKDFTRPEFPSEEELKAKLKEERERLSAFQTRIKEASLPVMILFEGWNAAGKGAVIGAKAMIKEDVKEGEVHD